MTHHKNSIYQAAEQKLDLVTREKAILSHLEEFSAGLDPWLIQYRELLQDPKPFLGTKLDEPDKFSALAKLAVQLPVIAFPFVSYLRPEVAKTLEGFDFSTVRGWQSGIARPSRFVLEGLIPELRDGLLNIADNLLGPASASNLVRIPNELKPNP